MEIILLRNPPEVAEILDDTVWDSGYEVFVLIRPRNRNCLPSVNMQQYVFNLSTTHRCF